ncbi:MAG: hypothetical protein SOH80_07595 [Eubacteriales bacterium]|jgi:hypothetical protein
MMYSEKVTLEREHPDYVNPRKVYVNVVAEFTSDGRLIPYRIEWTDGRKYMIDRVIGCQRMASRKAGGAGIRYLCEVCGQRVELYYEENYRWFVCRKLPGDA